VKQKTDLLLAQQLFNGLLGGIPEFKEKQALIVVPDGKLHLLPFAALADNGQYVLASHLVSVVPSGTVLHMLEHRAQQTESTSLPYVGVAAWTTDSPPHTLLTSIHRAVSGPERSELVALPESRHEVETIAADLPEPGTILLGANATETNFKQLPLSQFSVIHLALHGYVDPEIPDRSALVFAPQPQSTDDGLLQIREIRNLHLNANLVTLSACNTGVGPVGEEGVASIVNAFIEAGSQSVVSTLWELEDHATAHLMTTFYGHLGLREEKAVALREAQLEMLNSGLPPYYWAGFVLAGNPRGRLFPAPTVNLISRSSR
jgi:CHAT domain-containing protein